MRLFVLAGLLVACGQKDPHALSQECLDVFCHGVAENCYAPTGGNGLTPCGPIKVGGGCEWWWEAVWTCECDGRMWMTYNSSCNPRSNCLEMYGPDGGIVCKDAGQ